MGHHAAVQQTAGAQVALPIGRAQAELARALLSVVLIAVAPQGQASPAALSRAAHVCNDSPVFAALDPAALRDLGRMVLRSLSVRGPGPVIADVQGMLPRDMVETALCLAIRAARQGGVMPPDAMDRLGALAQRLGVPVDRFAPMVEVLAILDRAPA
jgi:hypothetical protein